MSGRADMDDDPLALDDESSWPDAIRSYLDANFDVLRSYEQNRRRLEFMGTVEYILAGQPANPFEESRQSAVDRIAKEISHRHLIGYHCTRLHPEEIALIMKTGLCPLSPERVTERVDRRVQAGDFSPETGERLKSQNATADSNRTGMLWFVFTERPLLDEWGVGPLLRSWGGEALYRFHEADADTGPVLRSVGVPCIVEAAVPEGEIQTFMSVGERLIAAYLGRRDISTRTGPDMEGYIRIKVPVRRVVQLNDPDFYRLTACDQWREPLV
jgi:hypothetical protein